jgi:hypothetical protein
VRIWEDGDEDEDEEMVRLFIGNINGKTRMEVKRLL